MKKKKVSILYRMPDGSPYIRHERTYGTFYKQQSNTGLMTGRKTVKEKEIKLVSYELKKILF